MAALTTEIENQLLYENARLKREVAEQKEELALSKKRLGILHKEPEVKYAFIKQNECDVSVTRQRKWLGVSTSGYYDWKARQTKLPKRSERQSVIDEAIAIAFKDRLERYGSPRLTIRLNETGFLIAENTVAASMRRQGLLAKPGRRFKAITNSGHTLPSPPICSSRPLAATISMKRGAVTSRKCGPRIESRDQVRQVIFEYIELDYTTRLHHSAINYITRYSSNWGTQLDS